MNKHNGYPFIVPASPYTATAYQVATWLADKDALSGRGLSKRSWGLGVDLAAGVVISVLSIALAVGAL